MIWTLESSGEGVGIPLLSLGGFAGDGSGHETFPVCSNSLKISIVSEINDPALDYVKIVFYATK